MPGVAASSKKMEEKHQKNRDSYWMGTTRHSRASKTVDLSQFKQHQDGSMSIGSERTTLNNQFRCKVSVSIFCYQKHCFRFKFDMI